MADLGEPLGFDSVWAAEHHFTDYTMCPDPAQLLTWLAGRTTRVQLGSMVMVLPWHDPVRVAESFTVLDHMSQGRGDPRHRPRPRARRVRGLPDADGRVARAASSSTPRRSCARSRPATSSTTARTTSSRGPRSAPAPFRSFRGRVYASSVSPESSRIMARLGVGIMIIAQKPWDKTIADLDEYRAIYREVNGAEPPKPLLVSFTAVHEDAETAREMFERYVVGYCALDHGPLRVRQREARRHPRATSTTPASPRNIEKHGKDKFSRFLAELQVWGTPDQVVEQMIENVRRIDGAGVIGVFSYGGMPPAMAQANIRLFAEKVLPRLKAHGAGATRAA